MNCNPRVRRRARGRRAGPARRLRLGLAARLVYAAAQLISVLTLLGWLTGTAVALFSSAAYAAGAGAGVTSIDQVVGNIRVWVVSILASWATLCLTVGFLRYSSGESGEVEKGKTALRCAVIGYIGAAISPLLVTIVGKWVS